MKMKKQKSKVNKKMNNLNYIKIIFIKVLLYVNCYKKYNNGIILKQIN